MRVIRVSQVVAAITVLILTGACAEPFSPPPNSGPEGQVLTVPGSVQPQSNQIKKLKPSMDPGSHRKPTK
jgi:hypothetical protein